jgi:hypothetical protein
VTTRSYSSEGTSRRGNVVTWEQGTDTRVAQEQGRHGTSTLCAALGVAAEEIGERVFMVDLDPRGSLSAWGERRKAEMPKFMGGSRMPQKGKTDGLLEASRRRLTGSASIPLQVTAEAIDDQCDTLDDDEIIVVTAPEWMLWKPRPKRKFRPS